MAPRTRSKRHPMERGVESRPDRRLKSAACGRSSRKPFSLQSPGGPYCEVPKGASSALVRGNGQG